MLFEEGQGLEVKQVKFVTDEGVNRGITLRR